MENCPECGAVRIGGKDCEMMREDLHAWEWEVPELFAVHFVFVSAYLIQHPGSLTPVAYQLLCEGFIEHLDGNLSVTEIRRRSSLAFKGRKQVRRPEGDRSIVTRSWRMTIADAHCGAQTGVADRVMEWARSIRSELSEM